MAQHFKQLIAWQKAMALVVETYQLTRCFPREEVYGLTSQIKRASVSIPSNIAEGAGRGTTGEFIHFLGNAYGSLCELETQLLIAAELKYVSTKESDKCQEQAAEVGRIVNGLIASLRKKK